MPQSFVTNGSSLYKPVEWEHLGRLQNQAGTIDSRPSAHHSPSSTHLRQTQWTLTKNIIHASGWGESLCHCLNIHKKCLDEKFWFKMLMRIHAFTMICSALDLCIFISLAQEGSMSFANEWLPQSGVMMCGSKYCESPSTPALSAESWVVCPSALHSEGETYGPYHFQRVKL